MVFTAASKQPRRSRQGEENGPKVAFSADKRAYVVWSIPGTKGDKTRANIRFAMDDGKGGFTTARTLNEVQDTARFPIIETTPDGNLLVAWIDRRIDGPKPRQLYLMRPKPTARRSRKLPGRRRIVRMLQAGHCFRRRRKDRVHGGLEVDGNKIRNHVLRKSTDSARQLRRAGGDQQRRLASPFLSALRPEHRP